MDALKVALLSQVVLSRLKQRPSWIERAERRLHRRLREAFRPVFDRILSSLEEGGIPSSDVGRAALLAGLSEVPLGEIVLPEAQNAAQQGRQRILSDLRTQGVEIEVQKGLVALSEHSPEVKRRIRDHTFEASRSTLARMRGDVMGALASAYEQGLGVRAAEDVLPFTDMMEWELERVARTEINGFQNMGAYETEKELRVTYHSWYAAADDRTRESHKTLHQQVVRVKERFGNGLKYPGDRTGIVSEWINCRCRVVPFIPPMGFGKRPTPFYEYDAF